MRIAHQAQPGNNYRVRTRRIVATLVCVFACSGCAGVEQYLHDRALDLTDVVDLKVGASWRNYGLGAKVEALNFLGVGLGYSTGEDSIVEWFGRRALESRNEFVHLFLVGFDGKITGPCIAIREGGSITCWCATCKFPAVTAQFLQYYRVGGEVRLPFVTFGAFLNFGEC